MPSSPQLLSAGEIAAQIRRKEISPVEVARAYLDRIERLNPKLKAFVDYKPEVVLAQAREAEKALLRGDELGPLLGVPLSIKSSIDVADIVVRLGRDCGRDMLRLRMLRWWLGCARLGR
jgi:Asp-tRNA(Asn)/Glu-tRNA(Gln) amidotransferase A subunit family amidase